MADPFTLVAVASTTLSVASKVSEAKAARADAMDDAARQESEAQLAETQALQRDTQLRDELTRFISATKSSRAANGLSANSPNAINLIQEASRVSTNDRLTQTANDKQRAANFRTGAANSRRRGRRSLLTGAVSSGVSIAQGVSAVL